MQKSFILQGIVGLAILAGVGRFVYALTQVPWTPTFGAAAAAFVLISLAAAWLLLRRHPGRPKTPWWLPASLLAGAALCGVLPPVNTAYLSSTADLPDVVAYLFSPFPEETAKLLAVFFVVAVFAPVRRPIESAVVGMAVGVGYTVGETVTNSAIAAALDLQSEYFDGVASMVVLVVMGPFSHAVYTGLAAWGLGQFLCRTDQPLGWRVSRLIGWFLLAVAIHGAFNASKELPGTAGLVAAIAVTVLLWVLLIWLYRRSRAVASHTPR